MKFDFYPRLAWDGIRKNRRIYFPYILTGCMMVMMYYILSYLIASPALPEMPGGSVLSVCLALGCLVIAVFSLFFLFYTNSFLIKQRYREFGLYNVLGMGKKNICYILVWESFFVAGLSITLGLIAGVVLSKAAELILLNLLKMDITYNLNIGIISLRQTPLIFGGIYLILLLNSLIRVRFSKPLELMERSSVGERIPKRTWLFALVGVILLAQAYFLAVSIQEPLTALFWFFIAVVLVIIGTYLIFIAGSVVFCKLLQKSKAYYYKPHHFVSVSSMIYRMKRNGAGLATICILLTMVLVMISSTTSLYFGGEDSLYTRCPYGINISVTFHTIDAIKEESLQNLRNMIQAHSGEDADLTGIRSCEVPGLITNEGILISFNDADLNNFSYDRVGNLRAVSLADYNSMMGTSESLAADQCLLYTNRIQYNANTFSIGGGNTYQIKEVLSTFPVDGDTVSMVMPTVYLVVDDLSAFSAPVAEMRNHIGEPLMQYNWRCGFDIIPAEQEGIIAKELQNSIRQMLQTHNDGGYSLSISAREVQRASFYDLYGSLFFLGIMLSIVFLLAAVLIIYYKQMSEGFEDHARFEIMQKVGMTKTEIRKSINSQMLTVFFLPLLFAGIHLCFAFPFITKIFRMFAFDNLSLSICVNLGCFFLFGILYTIVYKITSNIYFRIVSSRR